MVASVKAQAVKPLTVNPLKTSAPLGGASAFMGVSGALPMLHAAQGCTAFALVLLVRHYREAIPFQTTAMSEVSTILGGKDHLEEAILNIHARAHPKLIGICSNGLIEARGEDVTGDIALIRARHPELGGTALVYAQTPDYKGGFQEGWAAAVTAMVETLVDPALGRDPHQVNILAGCHLTPADIEEIRDTVEAFGLTPIILPDIAGSLDGHVAEQWSLTTMGGTAVDDIRRMGRSIATLALGLHMEPAARAIETRCGVPVELYPRLTGLLAWDMFIAALTRLSGRPAPAAIRRRRSQLVDAMLDGHFFFARKKIAIGAEPDLALGLSQFLTDLGAEVTVAITTADTPALSHIPAALVKVGDLDDLEQAAGDCDLLISHSHGARVAERLGVGFFRAGFPLFDRLGAAHRLSVGYRGARDLIFELGNLFLADQHDKGGAHATAASH